MWATKVVLYCKCQFQFTIANGKDARGVVDPFSAVCFKDILIRKTTVLNRVMFFDFGKICFVSAFEKHLRIIKNHSTTIKSIRSTVLEKKKYIYIYNLLFFCRLFAAIVNARLWLQMLLNRVMFSELRTIKVQFKKVVAQSHTSQKYLLLLQTLYNWSSNISGGNLQTVTVASNDSKLYKWLTEEDHSMKKLNQLRRTSF